MPYDKDWRGAYDGTPASKPSNDPTDYPEVKGSGDWKGFSDTTPSSKPTDPDK